MTTSIAMRRLLLPLLLLAGCDGPTAPGPEPATIDLGEVAPFLDVGQSLQLEAAALDEGGTPIGDAEIEWSSSDAETATVVDGLVTAKRAGAVTILARSGAAEGAVGLTVEPAVEAIELLPPGIELVPGKSLALQPRLRDAARATIAHSVAFSSSAPDIVSVSATGLVQAIRAGSATIGVKAGTKSAEIPAVVSGGYGVTLLGTLGGGSSIPLAINAAGQVVGRAQLADGYWHGFHWEKGRMTDLHLPGFLYSEAVAINDAGVIVGNAGDEACVDCGPGHVGYRQPWKREAGSLTAIDVAHRDGGRPIATDINNLGQVSGYTFSGYSRFVGGDAFVWSAGETRWLPKHGKSAGSYSPPDPMLGQAFALNDEGLVVGSTVFYALERHPTAWSGATSMDGGPVVYGQSWAEDVNSRGQIVGPTTEGMYLWEKGVVTLLGAPSGSYEIHPQPQAINDQGHVVGYAWSYSSSFGFLWRDGRYLDLNLLVDDGWTIQRANGINDAGQIVAEGRHAATGRSGALLLTPR